MAANDNAFLGVSLVSLSMVLLLSGLGSFRLIGKTPYIISPEADVLLSFVALAVGISYVHSSIKAK